MKNNKNKLKYKMTASCWTAIESFLDFDAKGTDKKSVERISWRTFEYVKNVQGKEGLNYVSCNKHNSC